MASRVNVKFVIILSGVLVAVFLGVVGAFVFVKMRSGDNYARQGAAALARGDINAADAFYARAVGKDRTNLEWLKKWREVREKKIPETESSYQDNYRMYVGILRTLATVQKQNLDAHREYLEELYQQGAFVDTYKYLISEAESSMRFFAPETPPAIRRYRGLAAAWLVAVRYDFPEQEKKYIELAREDLEAALQANPGDVDAAVYLERWHRAVALKAKTDGNTAAETRHVEAARKVMSDLVAAKPGDPQAAAAKLAADLGEIQTTLDPKTSSNPGEVVRQRTAAIAALRPRLAEITGTVAAADPAKVQPKVLNMLGVLALQIDPAEGTAAVLAATERVLQKDPENWELLALRGELAGLRADFGGSIATYQKLIELKNRPVSLAGMRLLRVRPRAMFSQTNAALALVSTAPDAAAAEAALKRAKELRQQLALKVPERSPELLFVDGKIKFAEADYRAAMRLLTDFIRAPGEGYDTPETLAEARLFLGDAAIRVGEPGLAREQLSLALGGLSDSTRALLVLGSLELSLQNREQAAKYFQMVLDRDPDNKAAKEQLELMAVIADGSTKLEDPVTQRLAEAERISRGKAGELGDELKALEYLERGLEEAGYDIRIVAAVVGGRLRRGENDRAIAIAEAAAAKQPGDARFADMLARLKAAGTLEGTIAFLDQSDAPALEKWLSKRNAYLIFNKADEAAKALAEAAKLAPDDPRVLEGVFLEALARNDMTEASRLTDRAAQLDIDRAEGDTFRARLQLAQNNQREAVATLQKAVARGNAQQAVYRLLGSVQLQLGRGPDAIASFRRALELNPSDLMTIKTLIEGLAQLNRLQEALDVARASEAFGRGDPDFMNVWLSLEQATGNTQFALERREQLLTIRPADQRNAAALIDLLITRRNYERSRSLLDSQRAKQDSVALVTLDARWHADQGNIEKAKETFVSYIAGLSTKPEPMTPAPYMAFAEFMLNRGQTATGLAALRQAARFQDPKTLDVDLQLANVQFSLRLFAEAEQTFRKVIAAGVPDSNNRLRKALIESLLRQEKYAEAEKECAALGAAADEDVDLLVQRSVAARGVGDRRRARELLDRAVAKFPNEPVPYFERARLILGDPAMISDAQADLATAIRLRPGMPQALQTRARVLLSLGQIDDAVRDLRTAVDANPGADEIRFELVDLLLDQRREGDAADLAEAGIKVWTGDPNYPARVAERFARRNYWTRAARLYKLTWEQTGSAAAAVPYVAALLSATPPGLAEADAVLATPALQAAKSSDLLMVRAALRKKQQRNEAATADAIASLALVGDTASLLRWHDRLLRIFTEPGAALAILNSVKPSASIADWMDYLKAVTMLRDPASSSQAIASLQGLVAPGKPKDLQVAACQALSTALYSEGKFEQGLEVIQAGLAVAPDNGMLNNNAAVFLSEKLGRPADALKFAEKAARIEPESDKVLDTLAGTYWALGRKPEAIQKLSDALRLTRTDVDKATYAMKLAGWQLQTGDAKGATAAADLVRELIATNPSLAAQIKEPWEALQKTLPAPR